MKSLSDPVRLAGEATMTIDTKLTLSRRALMLSGAASAVALSAPSIGRAQDKTLKVGVYGGYFKDSFDKHIFPDFTKATGIKVESGGETTGQEWLARGLTAGRGGE